MARFSRRQIELRMLRHKLEVAILVESSSDECRDSSDEEEEAPFSANFEPPTPIQPRVKSASTMKHLSKLYFLAYNTRYFVGRPVTPRVTPKSDEFASQDFHLLPEKLFRQMTRMDKATFFHLLDISHCRRSRFPFQFEPTSSTHLQTTGCLPG